MDGFPRRPSRWTSSNGHWNEHNYATRSRLLLAVPGDKTSLWGGGRRTRLSIIYSERSTYHVTDFGGTCRPDQIDKIKRGGEKGRWTPFHSANEPWRCSLMRMEPRAYMTTGDSHSARSPSSCLRALVIARRLLQPTDYASFEHTLMNLYIVRVMAMCLLARASRENDPIRSCNNT